MLRPMLRVVACGLIAFSTSICFSQSPVKGKVSVMVGHLEPVQYIVYSPDGKYVVTGSTDEAAIVWDAATGMEVQKLKRKDIRTLAQELQAEQDDPKDGSEKESQLALALTGAMPIGVSADNRIVVTAHRDQIIKFWDLHTGQEVGEHSVLLGAKPAKTKKTYKVGPITKDQDIPETVIWNESNISLVGKVLPFVKKLHDLIFEEQLDASEPINKSLLVAASKDMSRLVVGEADGVCTYSLPDMKRVGQPYKHHEGSQTFGPEIVRQLAISPDGKYVFCLLNTGRVDIVDPETGALLQSHREIKEDIFRIAFSSDSSTIALMSSAGSVLAFNVAEYASKAQSELKPLLRLDITRKKFSIFDLIDSPEDVFKNFNNSVYATTGLLVSPTGDRVYVGEMTSDDPNQVSLYGQAAKLEGFDTKTGAKVMQAYGVPVEDGVFTKDGKFLISRDFVINLTAGPNDRAVITSLTDGLPKGSEPEGTTALSGLSSVAFSPNRGRTVAFAGPDRGVTILDTATGLDIMSLRSLGTPIRRLNLSHGNELLGSAGTGIQDLMYQFARGSLGSIAMDPKVNRLALESRRSRSEASARLRENLREIETAVSPYGTVSENFMTAIQAPVRTWNPENGSELNTYIGHYGTVSHAYLDGNTVATRGEDGVMRVWDALSGDSKLSLGGKSSDKCLAVSRDGKYGLFDRVLTKKNGKFDKEEWQVADQTGNVVVSIKEDGLDGRSAVFSEDGKYLLATDEHFGHKNGGLLGVFEKEGLHRQVRRWDLTTKRSEDFKEDLMVFSNDARFGLVKDGNSERSLYSFETKSKVRLKPVPRLVQCLTVSPDGKFAAIGNGLNKLSIYDAQTGQMVDDMVAQDDMVTGVVYLKDGSQIATASPDCSIRVWDVSTKKEIVRYVPLGLRDWVVMTPDNYYMSSRSAYHGLSYREGDTSFPFEQFDLLFNRPDKVVQSTGFGSQGAIEAFKKVYERRLARLGVSESQLQDSGARPTIDIVGKDDVEQVTQQQTVDLQLDAHVANGRAIKQLQVWVNDVPVDVTSTDKAVAGKTSWSGKVNGIVLSSGRNKIQVGLTDSAGVEALRQTLFMLRDVPPVKSKLYIVAVGVSKYKDSASNLNYADADAEAIVDKFRSLCGSTFDSEPVVELITNDQATRERILKTADTLRKSGVDDQVVVFLSGHGLVEPRTYRYFFGTHDIDFVKPGENGFSFEDLETLFAGVPARRRLIMLDTCCAGEVDPSLRTGASTAVEGASDSNVKRKSISTHAQPQIGMADVARVGQQIFADLNRGIGAYIIAASGGFEYSYETEALKHGVFTTAVLEALSNPAKATGSASKPLTITGLREYVYARTASLTQNGQKPMSRQENLVLDFVLKK